MLTDEQIRKLEHIKAQSQFLIAATSSKDEAVLVISSLAATLLVVATFNKDLLPLTNLVKFLISILLALIPISLFTHLRSADRTAEKAVKNIEEVIGRPLPRNSDCADCYFSYYPYFPAVILTVVIGTIIFLIWN